MAKPSNMWTEYERAPVWFVSTATPDLAGDGVRFRADIRCVDGDAHLVDVRFTSSTLRRDAVGNTKREVLQHMHEFIVKQLAILELERE